MYISNFYVGSQEYVIVFKNGTHNIVEVLEEDYGENPIVFSGFYDDCLKFKEEMEIRYQESLY